MPDSEIKSPEVNKGDCLDFMRSVEDDAFDLAITDPPYGITKAAWDVPPSQAHFDELFRVSKRQIIFGGHFFRLPPKDGWIVWNKMPFLKTTNQAELLWTSFLTKNVIVDFRYAGNVIGGRTLRPDYSIKKVAFTSQKPVQFLEYLIENYASDGESIFDPFMGSGTTLLAAQRLGFRATGIDIEPRHFDMTSERLAANA